MLKGPHIAAHLERVMRITKLQTDPIIFGFDSAWTDAPRAPGAICAIRFDQDGKAGFIAPRLVSFAQALDVIEKERLRFALCLIALDQPTIVPNATGMRSCGARRGIGGVLYRWWSAGRQSL